MMTEEEKRDYRGTRFVTSDTVHLFNKGRTLCEMDGKPEEWPEDHRLTGTDNPIYANCRICLAVNNEKTTAYKEALKIATEIDKGLKATDPRFRRSVQIRHEEGTTLFYRYAFVEKLCSWFLIFTEHHGYHVYHASDIDHWALQFEEVEIDRVDATTEPDKYIRCEKCSGSGIIWRQDYDGNRSGGGGCIHCNGIGKIRVE